VEEIVQRSCAIAVLCLLLAACAERGPERSGFFHAQATRPDPATGGADNRAVEITLADVPAGATVEALALFDPGGGRHPAEALTTATLEGGTAAPGAVLGLGVSIGSSSGIKPSLGLGLGTGLGEHSYRSRQVRARIPLPDPAAFYDHPERWRLDVSYRDVTGSLRNLVLPVAGLGLGR
jgi:hypothetical protein